MTDRPILFSGPMVRALLDGRKTQTRRLLYTKRKGDMPMRSTEMIGHPPPRGRLSPEGFPVDIAPGEWWALTPWQRVKPGDRLWVRERWRVTGGMDGVKPSLIPPRSCTTLFEAGGSMGGTTKYKPGRGPLEYVAQENYPPPGYEVPWAGRWRPGMFMPRWCSRITLKVAAVRVHRLQDISEQDAIAEGAVEDWADGLSVWYFPGGWTLKVKQHGKTAVQGYRWLWEALHGNWDHNPDVVALTFTVAKANIDALSAQGVEHAHPEQADNGRSCKAGEGDTSDGDVLRGR